MKKLAIYGGQPVRSTFLPYAKQFIDEEDKKAVVEVLGSDYLTTGPKIQEFERQFAEYVGARYGVAVINGTAALHAACFAIDIQAGDEVITTPMTFTATANSILYCGGKPIFADIDQNTYNIDISKIEALITEKTKAIIPVHFTGQPVEMEGVHTLAQKYNLKVIEDAAHALGSLYKGEKVGGLSDMTIFSFHPVKHITTGEGGMITTNDEGLYKRLQLFRTHGITRDPNVLTKQEGPWYYEQQALGYNYRITDIQAALGCSQLHKIEVFLQRRKEIVAKYNDAFQNIEGLVLPKQLPHLQSAWHLYVIQIDLSMFEASRKEIYEALIKENIGVNVHYIPVYYHPYYQKLGYKKGICPNAEALYDRMITLPLFYGISDQDVSDVITAVQKVLQYYKI